MSEFEKFLYTGMEKLLHLHEARSEEDWTQTYCDLQFLPLILQNLQRRGIFTPESFLDFSYAQAYCQSVQRIFSPQYLEAYCNVIATKYDAYMKKSSRELAIELYFYWLHLHGLAYLLAVMEIPFPEDHTLLREYIERLNDFVANGKLPLPQGWPDLAEFFLDHYRTRYPCDIKMPRKVRQVALGEWEMYRLTHIILKNTHYLQKPLSAEDIETIERLVSLQTSGQGNIDASAEFFMILRTSSGYAGSPSASGLPQNTVEKLRRLESEYVRQLYDRWCHLSDVLPRIQWHSYITIPLYLSTVPRSWVEWQIRDKI